jgi:hypothetical protein
MSKEALLKFISDAQTNKTLLGELKKIEEPGLMGILGFANTHGYDFSLDEMKDYIRVTTKGKLSEEDIEKIVTSGAGDVMDAVLLACYVGGGVGICAAAVLVGVII